MGFTKDLELMNVPAQLIVPANWSDDRVKEMRDIFLKAGKTKTVLDAYKADYCQNINQMPEVEIQPWYNKQTADWKRLTNGVSLK